MVKTIELINIIKVEVVVQKTIDELKWARELDKKYKEESK